MRKKVEKRHRTSDPVLTSLIDAALQGEQDLSLRGLQGASGAFLCARLFKRVGKSVVVVTESQKEAAQVYQDLQFFLDPEDVLLHPAWDLRLLTSDDILSFQQETMRARIAVLARLFAGRPSVVVAAVGALIQRVMPLAVLGEYLEILAAGDTYSREELVNKLLHGGYQRVSLVEEMGEFSQRGYIMDVFPVTSPLPVRLEFYGDDIESIRIFDPESQRSRGTVESFVIAPASEIVVTKETKERALKNLRIRSHELDISRQRRDSLADLMEQGDIFSSAGIQLLPLYYDTISEEGGNTACRKLDTLFDYLPKKSIVALFDEQGIHDGEMEVYGRIERFFEKARAEERFYLDGDSHFTTIDALFSEHKDLQRLFLHTLHDREMPHSFDFAVESTAGLKRNVNIPEPDHGLLAPFVERVREWLREGTLIAFVCGEEEAPRIMHLFQGYSLPVEKSSHPIFADLEQHGGSGRLLIKAGAISEGFEYRNLKFVLISQDDVFGQKIKRRRKRRAREGYFLKSFGELKEGDHIVHVDHGIGLYRGLNRLSVGAIENDFLLIEYLGGDRLYIPVDRLDQIQRYIGPDGQHPGIDRLGGTSWDTVKKRARESVRKIAEELVALYAAREVMEGHSYARNNRYYDEFCSSFEYEETPDQASAIEDVNEDMDNVKPMDRLICGDAGFGKTEVALRASFRAAMDGKQVAVLVPTTILAEQHYRTFSRRFADYPFRVEVLNRFKTKKEQSKIVADVNKGLVDVVIGTHRILQKDVLFKNLGLVVIDEEQRFGVADKEKLKKLRALVDVVALTATPIPRTMQLSLAGLRDLSVIDTPPEDRQEVKVYVAEFDEDLIRDALELERERGGQVFFIHDRVQSIEGMAHAVRRIVPEARVGVAHGQMHTKELEEIMIKFLRKEIDVLVCTTIVGAGVDIATANTIVINRADRLGLSQLYQLRGRVGRAREQAFAYLLVPKGAVLTKDARKRLRVAREFSAPGSGFKVAAYDLEIRGAGNIVGVSQSGHVSAVGYELYMELMEQAIGELRGETPAEATWQPEIHLGVAAFIPDNFIADTHDRLIMYKKLSMADSEEALADIGEELADRYGSVPEEVYTLIDIIRIKLLLKRIKVQELRYDGTHFSILFSHDTTVEPQRIVALAHRKGSGMHFSADNRLAVMRPQLGEKERVEEARELIRLLAGTGGQ